MGHDPAVKVLNSKGLSVSSQPPGNRHGEVIREARWGWGKPVELEVSPRVAEGRGKG